jgi:hypothetical protein
LPQKGEEGIKQLFIKGEKMKAQTAKIIADAADIIGSLDVRVREDYSGRCMYGKTTTGLIIGSYSDLLKAVAYGAAMCQEAEKDEQNHSAHNDLPSVDDFIDDLDISSDSMGRDSLIVY